MWRIVFYEICIIIKVTPLINTRYLQIFIRNFLSLCVNGYCIGQNIKKATLSLVRKNNHNSSFFPRVLGILNLNAQLETGTIYARAMIFFQTRCPPILVSRSRDPSGLRQGCAEYSLIFFFYIANQICQI